MRPVVVIVLLLAWHAPAVLAGSIRGKVEARGKELPASAGGGYQSKKHMFLEPINYAAMRDFVVYLESPYRPEYAKRIAPVRVVVQANATFTPRVLPIMVGTTVAWPNEDDIYHNAFSISDAQPFDLGLYKDETKKVVFEKPGRVDVYCSIHKDMHCIVLVLENPWFAATDARNRYEIKDVPPGVYRLTAWHDRLPRQTQEVTVTADGVAEVDFVLGITGLPTY